MKKEREAPPESFLPNFLLRHSPNVIPRLAKALTFRLLTSAESDFIRSFRVHPPQNPSNF
ncbi:MAG: hypothetical protein E7028_09120 [Planctomycetaceae bacterium]|nr:hypothetical protein [Planctomycetaceae bacterium]